MLGYVGQVTAQQLKRLRPKGYRAGDEVGQSGVEHAYDTYLRGTPGLAAAARRHPRPADERLELDRQPRAGPRAPAHDRPRSSSGGRAGAPRTGSRSRTRTASGRRDGGAIVALDPRDGAVLALASYPTYKPSVYAGRVSTKKLAEAGLTGATAASEEHPALDRATQGIYPAGSTFKPVTALAAMEGRLVSPCELDPVHAVA